jgi:hypothetical protein
VNAALVPAALQAAVRLGKSGIPGTDRGKGEAAAQLLDAWRGVERLFAVEIPRGEAAQRIGAFAAAQALDPRPALQSLDGPVRLHAIALDGRGRPIPVMHSDDGFMLLFGEPDAGYLEQVVRRLAQPYPAGLRTPVGIVVANAAYVTDPELRGRFLRDAYHGAVVWSWQQAMLAAGLARQLQRRDLPAATTEALRSAQASLWALIEATAQQRIGELWTWEPRDGQMQLSRFGSEGSRQDESNAVQLWSLVYLAVKPRNL